MTSRSRSSSGRGRVWFGWRCNLALEQRTGKPDIVGEMVKSEGETVESQTQRIEKWRMETVAPSQRNGELAIMAALEHHLNGWKGHHGERRPYETLCPLIAYREMHDHSFISSHCLSFVPCHATSKVLPCLLLRLAAMSLEAQCSVFLFFKLNQRQSYSRTRPRSFPW